MIDLGFHDILARLKRSAAPDRSATGGFAEPLKRNMPLIPGDTIAGRALVTVIAIMTFLAFWSTTRLGDGLIRSLGK